MTLSLSNATSLRVMPSKSSNPSIASAQLGTRDAGQTTSASSISPDFNASSVHSRAMAVLPVPMSYPKPREPLASIRNLA